MSTKKNLVTFLYKYRVTFGFIYGFMFLVFSKPTSIKFIYIGLTIALFGEFIRLLSSGYLIKTDRLTTNGPYSFVRHPLYFGSFLMGLGLCVSIFSIQYLTSSTIFMISFLLLFLSVYIPVLRREESVLIEKYSDLYKQYKNHVPMLLPRLFPYSSKDNEEVKFDKKVFMRNREYRALLGLLFIIIIIFLKFKFI
ncbi:methyltransferase family protein [bacterium]